MSVLFTPIRALEERYLAACRAVDDAKNKRARVGRDVERMGIVWKDSASSYCRGPEGIGLQAVREIIAEAQTRAEAIADGQIIAALEELQSVRMAIRREILPAAVLVEMGLVAEIHEAGKVIP